MLCSCTHMATVGVQGLNVIPQKCTRVLLLLSSLLRLAVEDKSYSVFKSQAEKRYGSDESRRLSRL